MYDSHHMDCSGLFVLLFVPRNCIDILCFVATNRFRKIKSDPVRLKDIDTFTETTFWRFGHPQFRRDQPELLVNIKKVTSASPPSEQQGDKGEASRLKREIKALNSQLTTLSKTMDGIKANVHQLVQLNSDDDCKPRAQKKTKLSPLEELVDDGIDEPILNAIPTISIPEVHEFHTLLRDPYEDFDQSELQMNGISTMLPELQFVSSDSTDDGLTLASHHDDEEMLVFLPELDVVIDDVVTQAVKFTTDNGEAQLLGRLCEAVSMIPSIVQTKFVDHMVSVITNSNRMGNQVDAVNKLVANYATEAQQQALQPSKSASHLQHAQNYPEMRALAGAVLGAYLDQPSVGKKH
jgi:hypothetical protein